MLLTVGGGGASVDRAELHAPPAADNMIIMQLAATETAAAPGLATSLRAEIIIPWLFVPVFSVQLIGRAKRKTRLWKHGPASFQQTPLFY